MPYCSDMVRALPDLCMCLMLAYVHLCESLQSVMATSYETASCGGSYRLPLSIYPTSDFVPTSRIDFESNIEHEACGSMRISLLDETSELRFSRVGSKNNLILYINVIVT